MSKLIAIVATAVYVNGERTVIQPGEPLPEDLNEHDAEQLTKAGAARDLALEAKSKRAAAAEAQRAADAFEAQRQQVIAANASTAAPEPAPQEPQQPPAPPATKTSSKKS